MIDNTNNPKESSQNDGLRCMSEDAMVNVGGGLGDPGSEPTPSTPPDPPKPPAIVKYGGARMFEPCRDLKEKTIKVDDAVKKLSNTIDPLDTDNN